MALPHCPYCRAFFTPSRYHPKQAVCSSSACQRQRRTDNHRQRIKDDPSYRAQCRDSQQKWREQNPEYMRNYRRINVRQPTGVSTKDRSPSLTRLLENVKNSAAFDLTSYPAKVWLVSSDERIKNILASAELI